MLFTISKENTRAFLARLQSDYEVYGPVKAHEQDVYLQRLSAQSEVTFDYLRLPLGIKTVLYPQTDPMIHYHQDKIIPLTSSAPKVIFGLRSCDVCSVRFTDHFFHKNFDDAYYSSKRAEMILVSIACNTPDQNCFCTSTKTGPFLKEGFDLQFTDAGNDFLVEVGSQQGEKLLAQFRGFYQESNQADKKQKIHEEAVQKFQTHINIDQAVEILKSDKITPEFWQKWADQCIYCGGCSYSCCTCTCFNVIDRGTPEGIRYRCWDSCQFSGYTREASQHNPRPKDGQRMRRWFEHKLKYDVIANSTYSCMGCGRCSSVCPGFIGMINIVSDICAKGGK